MAAILLENALLIALGVILVVLAFYLFRTQTSLGLRSRQNENRRTILDEAKFTCPVHGFQSPESLVRLDDGTVVCSHCFKGVIHGDTNVGQ